ncbi:MAG: hypothetical protein R3B70_16640 [Polyangiaceae bacterium]
MAERIVVSLHLSGGDTAHESFARRALAAKKRAEALGAGLCALAPDAFAFDFAPTAVEEAVDLALATFDDAATKDPRFSAGLAFGSLLRIGGAGSTSALAAGPALSRAWRLARSAGPGEVLVDERCPAHLHDALRMHGDPRVDPHGGLTAFVLDTRHPFRRDTVIDELEGEADAKVRVTVPPLPPILGLARDLWERAPSPASTRTPAGERRPSEPPPPSAPTTPASTRPPPRRAPRLDAPPPRRAPASTRPRSERLDVPPRLDAPPQRAPRRAPAASARAPPR